MKNIKIVNNFVEIKIILVYEKNWLHCLIPVDRCSAAPGTQAHPTVIAGIPAGHAVPGS